MPEQRARPKSPRSRAPRSAPTGGSTAYLNAAGTWTVPAGGGSGPSPAGTVVTEEGYGQSSAAGSASTYSRGDHTHGSPALTTTAPAATLAIGTAAALGTANLPALADHVHPMAAAATPTNSAVADVAATGAATTFATSNHVHGREGFGSVAALTGFSVASANGTATTVSHSDHVHGSPGLPTASTSTAGIVQLDGTAADIQALGSQAAGSIGKAADAGHVHPTTGVAQTANNLSDLASAPTARTNLGLGSAATLASGAVAQTANNLSDLANATTARSNLGLGTAATAGSATTGAAGIVQLAGDLAGTATAPTVAKIQGTIIQTPPGINTEFLAGDGSWQSVSGGGTPSTTVVTEETYGQASSAGSASTYSRGDHTHGTPALTPYMWDMPSDRGWAEWNWAPGASSSTASLATGTITGASFFARTNKTVSKIWVDVSSIAVTPVTGQNLIAVYSISGATATQITITGDLGTWTGTGLQSFNLGTPITLVPGAQYLVEFLSVAATAVKLVGPTNTAVSFANAGMNNATAGPYFKFYTGLSTQTSLPASFTISSGTMNSGSTVFPWFALS